MDTKRIAIITDSGTNVPPDFVAEHNIRITPLRINYSDGSSYESGLTITPAELVARFEEEVPKTSLPSPEGIKAAFDDAKAAGYEGAVYVAISSGLSATCDTARMIAESITDFPIYVVDTKNIGIASGLIVIEAQRLIEQGLSLEEIGAKLDQASLNTRVYFSVPSLEYLRKGGRISEAIYRIGSMLNIKPVLTCDENGKYTIAKKTRGWQKSLAGQIALGSAFAQQFDHVHVGICCSAPNIIYSEMDAMIKEAIPNVTDFRYVEAGSDLVVHTGPGLVGYAVFGY